MRTFFPWLYEKFSSVWGLLFPPGCLRILLLYEKCSVWNSSHRLYKDFPNPIPIVFSPGCMRTLLARGRASSRAWRRCLCVQRVMSTLSLRKGRLSARLPPLSWTPIPAAHTQSSPSPSTSRRTLMTGTSCSRWVLPDLRDSCYRPDRVNTDGGKLLLI